jgi:hypothetical protein
MREELIRLLEEYSKDRAFYLEKRLVAGAIIASYGEDSIGEALYKTLPDKERIEKLKEQAKDSSKTENLDDLVEDIKEVGFQTNKISGGLTDVCYDSIVKKERAYMYLDSGGLDRESKTIGDAQYIDIKNLITDENYVRGNKTKLLKKMISAIFIDPRSFEQHIMPKEAMNLMEKLFNVTFNRYGDESGKVYINKGTFSSVFYKVKKEAKAELDKRNMPNLDYNDFKNLTNILLRQTGLDEEDKTELVFEETFAKDPYEDFKTIFPSYESIKDKNLLKELNPVLEVPKEYNLVKSMSCEVSETMYPHLFREVYKNTINKVFYESIESKSIEELRDFCKEHSEILEFDAQEKIKDMGAVSTITYTGDCLAFALGIDRQGVNSQYVSGMVVEALTMADNTHDPLSMKKIKELVDKIERGEDEITEGLRDKYMAVYMNSMLAAAKSSL